MSTSFDWRITATSDALVSIIAGESVILNCQTESYFGLDHIGTRMWAALTTSASIQAAYEILDSEFDTDESLLRRDLLAFIEQLADRKLIELHAEIR